MLHIPDDIIEANHTLTKEIERTPENRRALLLSDLFSAVVDGNEDTPPFASSPEEARAEGVAGFASSLWRRLIGAKALTPKRANAIAVRLAPCCESPAQLYCFEQEARAQGCERAADLYAHELDARFPRFRGERDRMPIDRAFLDAAGFDFSNVTLRFHPDGHLAQLSTRDGTVTLTLNARPGSGSFEQTGKRGGYGFHVVERYSSGHASGTLCSPWHDGDDYRERKDWMLWVLENVSEIVSASQRAAAKSKPKPKAKSKAKSKARQ